VQKKRNIFFLKIVNNKIYLSKIGKNATDHLQNNNGTVHKTFEEAEEAESH
jgi:hypothetical protein